MGVPLFLNSGFLSTFLSSRIGVFIGHHLSPSKFKSYFTQPGLPVNKFFFDSRSLLILSKIIKAGFVVGGAPLIPGTF